MWINLIDSYLEGYVFTAQYYLDDRISVLLIEQHCPDGRFHEKEFMGKNEAVLKAAQEYQKFLNSVGEIQQLRAEASDSGNLDTIPY